MSIRAKLATSIITIIAVFCVALKVALDALVYSSFEDLERSDAEEDVDRIVQAIEREAKHLETTTQDWSVWDDAYRFAKGEYEEFRAANTYDGFLEPLGLSLASFYDLEGKLLIGAQRAPDGLAGVDLSDFPSADCDKSWPLLHASTSERSITGLIESSWGPMLVCSAPILQNERVGPAVGTLVMARALDRTSLTKLARETHVAFSLRDLDRQELETIRVGGSDAARVSFREHDQDTLIGSTVLRDVTGRPLRRIEARIHRSITAKGRAAIDTALFSVLASAALLLIALTVLLKHSVVGPLTRFTTNALRIGSRDEIVAELDLDRADEFGALSRRFAEMLTELARFHAQLADASHKAGMSEIATDVLHSVGNLLNSVQVSAGMVRERLDELSSEELSKVATLLRQKGPDLGRFIQEDAAGRRLPELLERLGSRLAEGREKALSECSALCSRIGDVAELVRAQQDLAGGCGVQENIELPELIDLALTLTAPEKLGIVIERDFGKLPRFCTDRHKLLQTLVNLLKNAVEAFEGVDRQDRRIRIAATEFGGGVRIAIEDNACGIAEDVLSQIFQHGFSTKPTGHGFGLHSVGVTVGALRGKIAVHSDGPGKGATFVIDLPLEREASTSEPAASDAHPKRALSQKA